LLSVLRSARRRRSICVYVRPKKLASTRRLIDVQSENARVTVTKQLKVLWDGLSIVFIGINRQRPPNGQLLNAFHTNTILLNALFCLQRGIVVWVDSSHAPDSQLPSFVGAAAVPLRSVRRLP
jgi:hypothetical protein